MYKPTWVEICTFAGSFGLFMTLFLLFCRYLPMVAMAEVKSVLPASHPPHDEHKPLGDYWGDHPGAHAERERLAAEEAR